MHYSSHRRELVLHAAFSAQTALSHMPHRWLADKARFGHTVSSYVRCCRVASRICWDRAHQIARGPGSRKLASKSMMPSKNTQKTRGMLCTRTQKLRHLDSRLTSSRTCSAALSRFMHCCQTTKLFVVYREIHTLNCQLMPSIMQSSVN